MPAPIKKMESDKKKKRRMWPIKKWNIFNVAVILILVIMSIVVIDTTKIRIFVSGLLSGMLISFLMMMIFQLIHDIKEKKEKSTVHSSK